MIKNIYYGWWIVLSCSLISLYVGGAVFFGFTAFFEPIHNEFGWSYAQISLATSLKGLEMGIFAPFAGILVDRYGPRIIVLWGIILTGLGMIVFSQTQNLTMFYLSYLFMSFGAGGCTAVVTMTAVANWFQKRIGIALGLMSSGIGAGGLMVFIVVQLIDRYQWRTTLVILGIGMWIIGIPLSLIIRNRPEDYGYSPDGEPSNNSVQTGKNEGNDSEINFKTALKKRSFIYLTIADVIRMMTISTVYLHIMPYLSSLGIPRSTSGLLAGAVPIIGIIGRFGFGWLGDVYDKKYILTLTFSLICLGVLSFANIDKQWAIVPFLLFFPIGHGGSMVSRGSILRENYGRESFGKIIGFITGAGAVGGIIGPTLAGLVFDIYGSYQPIWLLLFGLSGLATLLIFRMK